VSYVSPTPAKQNGAEQLTVSSSAVGLASIPAGANKALIRVSTANIRWRGDGTNPTSSAGMPQYVDDEFEIIGGLAAYKFIRSGASDATLDVAYYRV
jgi:hypothetical protein